MHDIKAIQLNGGAAPEGMVCVDIVLEEGVVIKTLAKSGVKTSSTTTKEGALRIEVTLTVLVDEAHAQRPQLSLAFEGADG